MGLKKLPKRVENARSFGRRDTENTEKEGEKMPVNIGAFENCEMISLLSGLLSMS